MKSGEIRESFLRYFEERGHRRVKSSSLVPDDPTLLLTNAGMVQFKPYFLGTAKPEFTRATSCQKCVRTTDIEKVGRTARHLTFFEMLGNFSFGDYYKAEAIPWAWDFLTQVIGIDPSRLYCSVFREDDEAYEVWRDVVGVPEDRIVRLGEEDNFWDMGTTGPCGPCSEIIYDQGEEFGCGRPDCRVGCDCDRYLELWNLVFMQYNRDERGELHPLPSKNIDTGLGLERLASVLQGARTNFETDTIYPIIQRLVDISGVPYGRDEKADVSLKLVADHSRAFTFLVGDGVLPSNEDRGYVLRRLIRRAVRHARLLGIERPFLREMVDAVVETLGDVYPELKENRSFIHAIVGKEEERFSQTLRAGLAYFEEAVNKTIGEGSNVLPGDDAFHLHDTLGFPLELTVEMASERGLEVDVEGFERLMEEQRERARAAREDKGYEEAWAEVYTEILENYGPSDFTGYQTTSDRGKVAAIVKDGRIVPRAATGDVVEVFLDRTPFYAEKGGQVGDRGVMRFPGGNAVVEETRYAAEDLIAHRVRILEGMLEVGHEVEAEVDVERRWAIRRNHTATHLLHWALGQVLGEHAKQAGSLVDERRLRFDFTHFQALTPEEKDRIEELVNEKILENQPVRAYITTFDYAREIGAVALFGEKYGDFVRVVEVGEISRELCGGTHVNRTGDIGHFVLLSESGIGSNLRRIEALTGMEALRYRRELERTLSQATRMLKTDPARLPERIERLLERVKELESELRKRESRAVAEMARQDAAWREEKLDDGRKVAVTRLDGLEPRELREMAERALAAREACVVGIASVKGDKANLVVAVRKELCGTVNAVELVRRAAEALGGGGGGRPDMAVGGGSRLEGVGEALDMVARLSLSLLKG
ncbi:MAG: alanine--tRNA ligase [Candidatus Geothermincolales bacterium]